MSECAGDGQLIALMVLGGIGAATAGWQLGNVLLWIRRSRQQKSSKGSDDG